MNRIHSSILALVMCIFLIQATDPPYEKPTGNFVNFFRMKMPAVIFAPFLTDEAERKTISDRQFLSTELQPPTMDPQELRPPELDNFNNNYNNNNNNNNNGNNNNNPGVYSTLQDYDYVSSQDNPTDNLKLPLYPPIHPAPATSPGANTNENIGEVSNWSDDSPKNSSEERLPNKYEELIEQDFIKPLLKLYEKVIHQDDNSSQVAQNSTDYNRKESSQLNAINSLIKSPLRRDDVDVVENHRKEHIGEILPVDPRHNFIQHRLSRTNEYTHGVPIVFPSEVAPEIEGFRGSRSGLTFLEHFRVPRRYNKYREVFFDPSARYQTAWSPRRPRVIFPTDQVAFRDPVQSQELDAEWLAGDNSLQDLQEQDVRDRGMQVTCAPGATCEFFITCWLSGGLLDQQCDGLFRGCCFRGRVAKIGRNGYPTVGTIEAPPETAKNQIGTNDLDLRCGVSSQRQAQRRIVGGEEAGFGTFPWQAYIRIGSSRCGGSLVSRKHVVTAGHCVARATPRQVHVTLGDYVINSAVEPLPAYTFGVVNIQVHPYFKFTPQADRFDVAVLRLDRAAHNLPHIVPICLPPHGENFLGEAGVAAGWGALSPGSRLRPQTLQAVKVPVIDNKQCERWHRSKGISVTIYDEMMCAGYKNGGRDSCQGDSGGPLMLQKAGRWFLIGIVSAGYSCAQPGQPGIYHRVAHTVDWISRAIGS
ncbi:unnamed protein product [Phyllotreta striolata]|uniref:Peptidase S1 domain-containing protein n=1 Tax=Phyllotreta striolata TaxID=444603 RepID=A0A9N9TYS9_PHYSR|nr:unnamed protein product [Phyllotreta striolata]